MKKIVAFAVAASAFSAPAIAATTDSVNISGVVAPVCELTAPADVTNLSLNAGAETGLGQVVFQCNDPQGYQLARYAVNQQLVDISGGGSSTTYAYEIKDLFSGPNYGPPLSSVGSFQNVNGIRQVSTDPDYGVGAPAAFGVAVRVGQRNGPGFAGTYGDTIRYEVTGQ
ncbi:hypothetical protein [Tsuneonella rigui]|uniref:hypothetical protein n=1 Tax=Tsuneonella rigui TaxID=1708790 RepID=UPI000F7E3DA6|nr:hypothetical protein [Tsuneonella rigui]